MTEETEDQETEGQQAELDGSEMAQSAQPKPRRGRPPGAGSKFTAEACEKILKAVEAGAFLSAAAPYAGVGKRSLDRWLERGQLAKSGPFHDFWRAMEKALAGAELRATLAMANAYNGTATLPPGEANLARAGKAARDYLERRYPKRWGRRNTVVGEGPGGAIQHSHTLNVVVRRSNQVDSDGRLIVDSQSALRGGAVDAEFISTSVILPAGTIEGPIEPPSEPPVEPPVEPAEAPAPAPQVVMASAGFGREPEPIVVRSGGPTWD